MLLSDVIMLSVRYGFPHSFFGNGRLSLPSPHLTSALMLVADKSYFTGLDHSFYRSHCLLQIPSGHGSIGILSLRSLPLPLSLLTLVS